MIASAVSLVAAPTVLDAVPGPAQSATRARFTIDGDDALEQHLATTCARIAAGVRGLIPAGRLEGIALAGGYGRGEGGVLRTPEGDRPYNDLEFYVFTRGSRHLDHRLHGHSLHVLGEILTPQAGVDVELRIASSRELVFSPVSMFSYDLVSGHRWLLGDDSLLRHCEHHRDAESIPLSEATRLLMNRCSGLLFAHERLQRSTFTAADADFVARNIAKAQLGAGDAVLTALAQYHWSVRERHRRLERLARAERTAWFEELRRHHAVGTEFKLHPTRTDCSRAELQSLLAEVVDFSRLAWLWVEHRRLAQPFESVVDYARHPCNKWPDGGRMRNALVNMKVLGPRLEKSAGAWHHPRERVLNALALLLWEPNALAEPDLLRQIQTQLRTRAADFPHLVAAYRDVWAQVN